MTSYINLELTLAKSSNGDKYEATLKRASEDKSESVSVNFDFSLEEKVADEKDFHHYFNAINVSQKDNDLRIIGKALYKKVFQEELSAKFREWSESRTTDERFRLGICIDNAPELIDVPWELLYSESDNQFLARRDISIVRYVKNSPSNAITQESSSSLKVLIVSASPLDIQSRNYFNERRYLSPLRDLFRKYGIVPKIISGAEATYENLQRELNRNNYDIFHFIGHGRFQNSTGHISLIGGQELKDYSASQLGDLLNEQKVKLAFLCSCQTGRVSSTGTNGSEPPKSSFHGVAQSLIGAGVPAVVAMQYDFPQASTMRFVENFYTGLLERTFIDQAMLRARLAIAEQSWCAPALYYAQPDSGKLLTNPLKRIPLLSVEEMRSDKTVILDFDGVVADTEHHHLRAYNIILRKFESGASFKDKVEELSDYSSDFVNALDWENYKAEYIELPTKAILTALKRRIDAFAKKYKEVSESNSDTFIEEYLRCGEAEGLEGNEAYGVDSDSYQTENLRCINYLASIKNEVYENLIKPPLRVFENRDHLRRLFGAEGNYLERMGLFYYCRRSLKKLEPREGLEKLLKLLKQFNWNVAIISLSTKPVLKSAREIIAEGFHDSTIKEYFKGIKYYSIEDVKDVDKIYEESRTSRSFSSDREKYAWQSTEIKKRLYRQVLADNSERWNPARTIAIEDGYRGVKAAKDANIKCIFAPLHTLEPIDQREFDLRFDSLNAISSEKLMSLIKPRVVHLTKSNVGYSKEVSDLLELPERRGGNREVYYGFVDISNLEEVEQPEPQAEKLSFLPNWVNYEGEAYPSAVLPDALIITPAEDSLALSEALLNVSKKGVKVITLDTKIGYHIERSPIPWIHIAPDFFKGGELAAEIILRNFSQSDNELKIAIFAGPYLHKSTRQRRLGFFDRIFKPVSAKNGIKNVKLVDIQYCDFKDFVDKSSGNRSNNRIRESLDLLVDKEQKIDAIFCESDILAKYVVEFFRCKNTSLDKPYIVGFDAINEVAEEICLRESIDASIDVRILEQVRAAWEIATTGKDWDLDIPQPSITPRIFGKEEALERLMAIGGV